MTDAADREAPRLPPALLALTTGTLASGGSSQVAALVERVAACAEAGLGGVLVREPALFDSELLELADSLRAQLGPDGWLGVHDRLHLATSGLFDGVQLGWQSLGPQRARTVLARSTAGVRRPALGYSAHADDPDGAREGADFLLLAPVFPTASHPDPRSPDHRAPLGIDGLAGAVAVEPRPIWALGGIDDGNASELRASGVVGIAVRGALLGRPTAALAARATRALLAAWEGAGARAGRGPRPMERP